MFGILNHLHPGISPHLQTPHRITQSVIPSHDKFKKVCPLSNDSGITMQTKYDSEQSYPNCIFGNKYKAKYPKLEEHVRRGLSVYKLNNQLNAVYIDPAIVTDEDNLDDPNKWMNHVQDYKIHIATSAKGWETYKTIRGPRSSILKCKLFGHSYNSPLDLFDLIAEEVNKKSNVQSSSSSSSSSTTTTTSSSSSSEVKEDQKDNQQEDDDDPDDIPADEMESFLNNEQEERNALDQDANAAAHEDTTDTNINKTSGGKCMDLLKALYKFIYTVALQAWVMVHKRFLSRTNHNQSQYEYFFYLVPKTDVNDCAYIINASPNHTRDNKAGIQKLKKYEEVMVHSENDSDEVVKYMLSVSASEFVACTLKYIINVLLERKIVTTQTEVKQRNYAISITNVCMINSVIIAGMQSVPISNEFVEQYNSSLIQKLGSPDSTIYVAQQFNRHFQYKMKVYGIKRLKHKNEFAFPVFVTGVFFTPDRPLNKLCDESILSNKQRLVANVTRSYFTYGAYFTPNSHISCQDAPNTDTFPSYLVRRCSYWYSFDKKSCLMYLSNYNPDDDIDSTLSDLDLCGVSELEWNLCTKNIDINLSPYQLREVLFDTPFVTYSCKFWPLEYDALRQLCEDGTEWPTIPVVFYILYIALTKLISDDTLLEAYNINKKYKNQDSVIMYILYNVYNWQSLSQCLQTLRLGRTQFKFHSLQSMNPMQLAQKTATWEPHKVESEMYTDLSMNSIITTPDGKIIESHDIFSLVHISMLYMKGDERYKQDSLITRYSSYGAFEIDFVGINEGKVEYVNNIYTKSKYYKMEGIEVTNEHKLRIRGANPEIAMKNLLELVSLYVLNFYIGQNACRYFCAYPHQSYRLLPREQNYLNVEEIRACLSFQMVNEQKKVLNLDAIHQAYILLSQENLDDIIFNPNEYIMLRHMRDIMRYSNRPEFANPFHLNILETIVNKMTSSRKRKLEHIIPEVRVFDSDEEQDNNNNNINTLVASFKEENASD